MAPNIPGLEAQASLKLLRSAGQGMNGRPVDVAPVLQVNNPTGACMPSPKLQLTRVAALRICFTADRIQGSRLS